MLLSDPSGVILQAEGDGRTLEAAMDIRLMPGANWNELTCGTNAIGTALSAHAPVQVHGGEHFCAGVKRWTCSAVVVRDLASGEILGALDVSGLQATYDRHCLALVIAAAGRIEAQLAAREAERRARVLDEGLGRLSWIASGGLLFFDRKGRLIRADARAGLSLAAMGIEPAGWNDARITVPISDSPPGARSQLPEWLRPEWIEPVVDRGEPIGAIVALPRPAHVGASTAASGSGGSKARASAAVPGGPFARIIGSTPALRQAIEKARVLADLDVPVLLQGETGVGKEVFAHAIHESGRRGQQGQFVVLNCGGLPRDILASELFGYVEGAFTGARRSGMIGKIEAANGGTLFLDEVGEMPIDVQPFFLRALEGGEVYPVGSNSPRKVQFRLITASNRDLKADVTAGRFRMDLFYRVSVTSIPIPSLADRKEDIPALVEHFSCAVAKRHAIPMRRFDPDVLVVFDCYQWPGNQGATQRRGIDGPPVRRGRRRTRDPPKKLRPRHNGVRPRAGGGSRRRPSKGSSARRSRTQSAGTAAISSGWPPSCASRRAPCTPRSRSTSWRSWWRRSATRGGKPSVFRSVPRRAWNRTRSHLRRDRGAAPPLVPGHGSSRPARARGQRHRRRTCRSR